MHSLRNLETRGDDRGRWARPRFMADWRFLAITLLTFGFGLTTLSGCGGDTAGPASVSSTEEVGSLQFSQHAITMAVTAPYDTVQLHATLRTTLGALVSDSEVVRYYVALGDTSITIDTLTGLVTAKARSYKTLPFPSLQGAKVIATVTVHGITFADTAICIVTPTAPVAMLDTFSIQPPADSLAVYQSGSWLGEGSSSMRVPVTIKDQNGLQIDLLWYLYPSDPTVVSTGGIDNFGGSVSGLRGNASVTLYAQTWYYGVARRDSLRIKVGYSHFAFLQSYQRTPLGSLTPQSYWWPADIDVTAPASFIFENDSHSLANSVTFDDSADILIDSASIENLFETFGFYFPNSQPGNVQPFFADTTGGGAACQAAQFDGTTNAADSLCVWKGFGWDNDRNRVISKPGTYNYHNLFGATGRIIVH